MPWTPPYPDGFQTGPSGGTPITAAALNTMQDGIEEAHETLDGQVSTIAQLTSDVAAISTPDGPEDVGALPYNSRYWIDGAWTAVPSNTEDTEVNCYSDGTGLSDSDAAATAPPGSKKGDAWYKKGS
jgi:hypothetical protein